MAADSVPEQLREYWDADAPTYARSPGHHPHDPAERAAWAAALDAYLPPGGRVLDVGSGTGFLSLLAASLGRRVTALDFSPGMLDRLGREAERRGLDVELVHGDASSPPAGPFDAVMQRHVLWTLPEPDKALAAWHQVTPEGRLLLLEGLWGGPGHGIEGLQLRARGAWRRLARRGSDHHAPFTPEMLAALPLSTGGDERTWCQLVEDTGWGPARLVRLRDVEWTRLRALPPAERALGTTPVFCVIGGR